MTGVQQRLELVPVRWYRHEGAENLTRTPCPLCVEVDVDGGKLGLTTSDPGAARTARGLAGSPEEAPDMVSEQHPPVDVYSGGR